MGFLDLKYDIFGLDINDSSIKLVKLKKKGSGFVLSSFNEVRISPGIIEDGIIKKEDILIRILKHAYITAKGEKIKTKYVVGSFPEKKSFLQVIKMPNMTEEELRTTVPFEAENYIPMPISETYLDFHVIPSSQNKKNYLEVLIVAAPRKIVDSYVSCLKGAGFIPVMLESESEAIARALVKEKNNPTILVDFGENNTNFIIYENGAVRFSCTISVFSQTITEEISRLLKVSREEAEKLKTEYGLVEKKNNINLVRSTQIIRSVLKELANQIKKYLNFYKEHSSEKELGEGKMEKILFCGGGAKLKGLVEFMSNELGIKAEIGVPAVKLKYPSKKIQKITDKHLTIFTGAIGLALAQTEINKRRNL